MSATEAQARLARADKEGPVLNDGQRAAALAILTQRDRFIGIGGRAGVGKTTMLGRVRPLLEAQGFTVLGMAGNANAARTLQEDAKIAATTLDRHLMRANCDLIAAESSPLERQRILSAAATQVRVIDEALQIGAKKMSRLMHLADRLGARVVMIGDTKQPAAIEAGKPFGELLAAGWSEQRSSRTSASGKPITRRWLPSRRMARCAMP